MPKCSAGRAGMTGSFRRAHLDDRALFETSPFLAGLMGQGRWRSTPSRTGPAESWMNPGRGGLPSFQTFRQVFRKTLDDPEEALLILRRFRVRTLLALAQADLENRIKPYQLRARLRNLTEVLVQGAWRVAENSLRERFVHPLILERRNAKPPVAVFTLSRIGSGDPWYTTGPAPIFVHSRAAEFAPALTEKDFAQARRSNKEWLPAREYFHRLARGTMFLLSVPDVGGKGYGQAGEYNFPEGPPVLPGVLVVLFSAFEDHFLTSWPAKERLALLRLRFLVGQERLGRAVEAAARNALRRTAIELGPRLPVLVNTWYRERAQAEGLPLVRGTLLDIERKIRLWQFQLAADHPELLTPSPLKALDLLVRVGAIEGEERSILSTAYNWQWFIINRLCLLGRSSPLDLEEFKSEELGEQLGLPGASAWTLKMVQAAQNSLHQIARRIKDRGTLL